MAAPATMGKYCTKLADMEIGDYIKCVYEAPYSNDAGYFSQLGTKEPYYIKTTTTTTDGVKADPVIEKVAYSELPTTPAVTGAGFFYLLKADYGMLIADRMVQQQISWETLNKKNYIYGGAFDAVNAQTNQKVDITITHKDYESTDTASDTTTTDNQFDSDDRYVETTRTQVVVGKAYAAATDNTAEVAAVPTTITVTKTRTNYAVIDYTPKESIVSVEPADPITVDFGATADDIATLLASVTTAKATVLKTDETTTYTKDVAVTWDTSAFKTKTIGKQTIYGKLADLSLDPDNPIFNNDSIQASVIINTRTDQIESVAAVTPVTVKYGTTQTNLATVLAGIPTVDITCKKDDGTTYTKTGVNVVWNASMYDTRTVGDQTIKGILEDLSSIGIANDSDVKAEVVVTTSKIGTIDSYDDTKKATAENGASSLSDLLGTTLTANVTTDYYNTDENVSTIEVTVVWDTSKIDATVPGTYTVNGTVTSDTSDYIVNATRPTATLTVKPRIDSYETLALTVENGTTADGLSSKLSKSIVANTTLSSGPSTQNVTVNWLTSSFDGTKPGVQEIKGTIVTNINEYTNKAGVPKYTITVKPTIDSYVSQTLTVDKGISVDDLISKLVNTITANTTESSGTTTKTFNVNWDVSKFDSSTTGDQTLTGSITDDITGYTNKAGKPSYTITVSEPTSTEG